MATIKPETVKQCLQNREKTLSFQKGIREKLLLRMGQRNKTHSSYVTKLTGMTSPSFVKKGSGGFNVQSRTSI